MTRFFSLKFSSSEIDRLVSGSILNSKSNIFGVSDKLISTKDRKPSQLKVNSIASGSRAEGERWSSTSLALKVKSNFLSVPIRHLVTLRSSNEKSYANNIIAAFAALELITMG